MTVLYPSQTNCLFHKIGISGSCVDNAGNGGNIETAVDIKTGKLYNVIRFDGMGKEFEIKRHPVSGTLFVGVQIKN